MREFRGKKMMGHVFRRWGFKIKVKRKRIGKKNMQFSGLLFFLSILEPSASAFAVVGFTWMKKKIIGCDKYFKVKHSVFYT